MMRITAVTPDTTPTSAGTAFSPTLAATSGAFCAACPFSPDPRAPAAQARRIRPTCTARLRSATFSTRELAYALPLRPATAAGQHWLAANNPRQGRGQPRGASASSGQAHREGCSRVRLQQRELAAVRLRDLARGRQAQAVSARAG